ncbi:phosphoribosylglycinamide formyltransferase, partial [Mesorhizobium sp. M2D.F.Ca.ET.140.01.1.1]|uniref:phosphoribosylglycinamide formyltransferase n=1 Tax=Mesorhizobium sp. M2D.F.Ca.ET.140.01.1.1 TaxID=2496664 RepID=UPI000FD52778
SDLAGLGVAKARGIATQVISRADHGGKQAHDAAIDAALTGFNADIVALAGYLRILTPGFVQRWQGRMINIHPALLPAFKGLERS